jgi:hypothetical protein
MTAAPVSPQPATTTVAVATAAQGCTVASASYGGTKTLLIRFEKDRAVRYTALSVLDGFERSMTDIFVRDHAPGGTAIGEFANKDQALAKARELCPGA